jgi:hypothetical protein
MITLQERFEQLPELHIESFEVAGELGYSDKMPIVTILVLSCLYGWS